MNMKKLLIFIAVDLVILLVGGYLYANWYFSNILLQGGPNTTFSQANFDRIEQFNLPDPEEITFESEGVELVAWYFDNPAEGDCGVMLLHGYSSNRSSMLYFSPPFWERGCDLFAYDARGHGDSESVFHTYGYHEKRDAVTAVKIFAQKSGLSQEQIGLVGASYGAATSLQTAPLLPNLAFVVADSPYQDLNTIVSYQAEEQFGAVGSFFVPTAFMLSEWRADFVVEEVSPKNAITEAEMPVLLLHAMFDSYTSFSHSEAIYEQADLETTMFHIVQEEEIDHTRLVVEDPEQYKQVVNLFLAEYVPNFGQAGGR